MNHLRLLSTFTLLLMLMGCGGTKLLKEPEPLVVAQALATSSDAQLSVTLDWVIYRDGPGTWAKNVDWDEYLIRVEHLGDADIQIKSINVTDSLHNLISPGATRKELVKGTKQTKKRYKDYGLKVKAGASTGTILAAGAVTAVAVSGAGAAAMYGSTAVAAGAATGVLLVPVLAVGGVVRGINNSKVNNEIERRQSHFPMELLVGEEKSLDVFYPLAPSPTLVVLTYIDSNGEHTIIVDTADALHGLHIPDSAAQ
jgi:hypothetical protein